LDRIEFSNLSRFFKLSNSFKSSEISQSSEVTKNMATPQAHIPVVMRPGVEADCPYSLMPFPIFYE